MDRKEDNITSLLSLFLSLFFKDFFLNYSPLETILYFYFQIYFHFSQDRRDHFFIFSLNSHIFSKILKRSERMKVNEEEWRRGGNNLNSSTSLSLSLSSF